MISHHLPLFPPCSLWSEHRHWQWHQWIQASWELHGGRGLPANPPHRWQKQQQHQPGSFPLPEFPQADHDHRLLAAIPGIWPGQSERALSQPYCHTWTKPLLQLRSCDLWDDQLEGHWPVQPEEHHPRCHPHWEEPWALLPGLHRLVPHHGRWVQQLHCWEQAVQRVQRRLSRHHGEQPSVQKDHVQQQLQLPLLELQSLPEW